MNIRYRYFRAANLDTVFDFRTSLSLITTFDTGAAGGTAMLFAGGAAAEEKKLEMPVT